MSLATQSVEKQKQPFFGGDGRSRLFTKMFISGDGTAVNFKKYPDALDVMKAENHSDRAKIGADETDIHPDFTNFIVQTALFHKEIDNANSSGPLKSDIKQALKTTMNLYKTAPIIVPAAGGNQIRVAHTNAGTAAVRNFYHNAEWSALPLHGAGFEVAVNDFLYDVRNILTSMQANTEDAAAATTRVRGAARALYGNIAADAVTCTSRILSEMLTNGGGVTAHANTRGMFEIWGGPVDPDSTGFATIVHGLFKYKDSVAAAVIAGAPAIDNTAVNFQARFNTVDLKKEMIIKFLNNATIGTVNSPDHYLHARLMARLAGPAHTIATIPNATLTNKGTLIGLLVNFAVAWKASTDSAFDAGENNLLYNIKYRNTTTLLDEYESRELGYLTSSFGSGCGANVDSLISTLLGDGADATTPLGKIRIIGAKLGPKGPAFINAVCDQIGTNVSSAIIPHIVECINRMSAKLAVPAGIPTIPVVGTAGVPGTKKADIIALRPTVFNDFNGGVDEDWYVSLMAKISDQINDAVQSITGKHFALSYNTADKSPVVKKLIDEVYGNWSELDPSVRKFYKSQMRLWSSTGGGAFTEVAEKNLESVSKDTSVKLRVNLLKTSVGADKPAFVNLIPIIPLDKISGLWYTTATDIYRHISRRDLEAPVAVGGLNGFVEEGNTAPAGTKLGNVFQYLYYKVFRLGSAAVPIAQTAPAALWSSLPFTDLPTAFDEKKVKKMFESFKVDDYVRKKLYHLKTGTGTEGSTGVSDEGKYDNEDLFDIPTKEIWRRDKQTGTLYTEVKGAKVYWDKTKPDDFKAILTRTHNCYATASYNDGEKCRNFMDKCIIEEDSAGVTDCIKFLKESKKGDFYENVKDAIKEMIPDVAKKLLNKLGFRKVNVFDEEAKRNIVKVQTVGSWIKHTMLEKLGAADKAIIEKNEPLLTYLTYVVAFVNASPALLNKDYNGPTNESRGNAPLSDFARNHNLKKRQVDRNGSVVNGLAQGLDYMEAKIKYGISTNNAFVLRPTYGGKTYASPFSPFNMQSGGVSLNEKLAIEQSGSLIRSIYINLTDKLRARNKSIAPVDDKKIKDRMQEMEKTQKELIENLKYIEILTDLKETFNDYSSEVLTMKNIEELAKSQNALQVKHGKNELNMISVFKVMNQLINEKQARDATEQKTSFKDVGAVEVA
jgi:hypothetical protein